MNHDLIVEQLFGRVKCFIENILQAAELHSVAATSLAILEHIRDVAHAVLQAKVELETQQRRHHVLPPCCSEADLWAIYGAATLPDAEQALGRFTERWEPKYPASSPSWLADWDRLTVL